MSHPSDKRSQNLADAGRDLFYAARSLVRQPGFTIFVVVTLALGIGANSAIFGLLDRLLLSPPPHIRDADRVVRLLMNESFQGSQFTMSTTSYPTFESLRSNVRSFAGVAAMTTGSIVLGRGAEATAIQGAEVSGSFFQLLGVRPEIGRFFGEEEDRPPAGLEVAVLSHAFWERQLAASPQALGSEIILDQRRFTIIGIAPPGFTGAAVQSIDVWIPLNAGMAGLPAGWREDGGLNIVALLARLKQGVAVPAARQEASSVFRHERELDEPDAEASQSEIRFLPLIAALGPDGITREGRIVLWLGGVTLAVFLIAVGNVTNLLLLRTARRQPEVAVRLALGMSRGRLVRLWLTESLLLAFLSGAVALVVANWGENLTRLALLPGVAAAETSLQPRVLMVTAVAAILAGLFAGFLPARQAGAASLARRLNPSARAGSIRRSPLLSTLLLLQIGLSTVLLAGAGLFVASLYKVRTENLGFKTDHILLAEVPRGTGRPVNMDTYYRDALEQIKRLPGVDGAIPVNALPFGAHNVPPISVPGFEGAPGQGKQLPFMNAAAPDYFRIMEMTIRRGRGFTRFDDAKSPLVVVVSETMARTIWKSADPLGKCIRIGYVAGQPPTPAASPSLPCREVVGVVNDTHSRSIRAESVTIMQYYVPYEQLPQPPFHIGGSTISGLLIRTRGEPQTMSKAVQKTLQSAGANAPYVNVRPYQDLINPQIRPWQLGATLFSIFGGLALTMAAIGLYGLLAYMVAQRRKEIGVKMALGARGADVVRGVVGEGLGFALLGLVMGGTVVLAMGKWFEPLLFGVSPRDPAVLATVALTLAVVAVLASLIPALRATRVDPCLALRAD